MAKIAIKVSSGIELTPRLLQLSGMYDCPFDEKSEMQWDGEIPHEAKDWSIGLIVGPSGCGKSTILRDQFGEETKLVWGDGAVVDSFRDDLSMREIADVCGAVGFNTIPAWARPFHVLSNGEKFRVELARRVLEAGESPIITDEFTSVVDRQVAKIGSHAVQKIVRRAGKRFVAASCHYDIVEWLQPDWLFEPDTMRFQWRSVQRRPPIEVEIRRVHGREWQRFAKFHYMSATLNRSATCFGLWAAGTFAAFTAILGFPHPKVRDIRRFTRTVVLPDWQGCGLAFMLNDIVAGAYSAAGYRVRMYPAHPSFIRSHDRSSNWRLVSKPQVRSLSKKERATRKGAASSAGNAGWGNRPCAVFEFVGEPNAEARDSLL